MATETIPKIRGKAVMHEVRLNLSEFTYSSVQKMGNCFALPNKTVEIEEKQKDKATEKSEVMKQAKKIGIIYEQTKSSEAKKFIGVLSGGYIYLYENKKDVDYNQYYYVKNAKLTRQYETIHPHKEFSVAIENSVNRVVFGFDKEQVMEDWIKAVKKLNEEFVSVIAEPPATPVQKKTSSKK